MSELLFTAIPILYSFRYEGSPSLCLKVNSTFSLSNTALQWRCVPALSCDLSFVRIVDRDGPNLTINLSSNRTHFDVDEMKDVQEEQTICLELCFTTVELCLSVFESLTILLRQRKSHESVIDHFGSICLIESNCRYGEYLYQHEVLKKGFDCIKKMAKELLTIYFQSWVSFVQIRNDRLMKADRNRWYLHASANQDFDLQAWYHATFYEEVYRLRGPFWLKEASLPVYKSNYEIIDQHLTPLEEATLAHVLCSPETTYGDVAGQIFIVKSIVSKDEFSIFQDLCSRGLYVTKHLQNGKKSKKLFRISFVDGNIYLTWKGKYGNQGVDLARIDKIVSDNESMSKDKIVSDGREIYISLWCGDREVKLWFDSVNERHTWKSLFECLVQKEQGFII